MSQKIQCPTKTNECHVGFDLDGTLIAYNFPHIGSPYPWVKPLFKHLSENKCVVWVYSARFNVDVYGEQAGVWFAEIRAWMRKHGLDKYARLTRYKPPGDVMLDDKGQRLIGNNRIDLQTALGAIGISCSRRAHHKIDWPMEVLDWTSADAVWPEEED